MKEKTVYKLYIKPRLLQYVLKLEKCRKSKYTIEFIFYDYYYFNIFINDAQSNVMKNYELQKTENYNNFKIDKMY